MLYGCNIVYVIYLVRLIPDTQETYILNGEKNEVFDNKEVLRQKMDIRIPLNVAKCGTGLHLKLPQKIAELYTIESGDEILVQMKFVRYCNVREVPKI